jgi:hypothetical protein
MPDRDGHLLSVSRFEAFLKQMDRQDQIYKEWIVVVWFHIALHYVDAVLADKKRWFQIEGHSDRAARMQNCDDTRVIHEAYHSLYAESKQARYQGTGFTALDLAAVKPLYDTIRTAMRRALQLID